MQDYKNKMVIEGVSFSSEVRWLNLWNNESYQKKQKTDTTQCGDKSIYIVESLLILIFFQILGNCC